MHAQGTPRVPWAVGASLGKRGKMSKHTQHLARQLLRSGSEMSERERRIITSITQGSRLLRDANHACDAERTFGARLADRVAAFGGSWTFIILFWTLLIAWMVANSVAMSPGHAFDPYPYILLNLVLSTLAAFQAPIIMMSQNRQAAKDRINAELDYEVNLKAELEISELHTKLDQVRDEQLVQLLQVQREQIRLVTEILRVQAERSSDRTRAC
jgi:uncharacterized membrane protein